MDKFFLGLALGQVWVWGALFLDAQASTGINTPFPLTPAERVGGLFVLGFIIALVGLFRALVEPDKSSGGGRYG